MRPVPHGAGLRRPAGTAATRRTWSRVAFLAALAGLCVIPGAAAAGEDQPGPVEFRIPAPRTKEAAPAGNPLWSIPLEALSATRERPLFSPSRRPARPPEAAPAPLAPAPPPQPVPPSRPRLSLIGTVAGLDDSFALFLDPQGKAVVRLRTGEGHEGWVLRSVSARDVLLQNDGASAVLALPEAGGGAAATPVRQVADGGAPVPTQHVFVPRRPPASPLDAYPDH